MADASNEFAGKSVLVTGAGKGIGLAIARMLAARGAEVVSLSRSADDLAALKAEIGGRTIAVDLADAEATRQAAREALPVDYLVNCAGFTILELVLDVSVESFDRLIAINTRAPLILTQEYARDRIAKGKGGAIVNVSSNASWKGWKNHAAYCASRIGSRSPASIASVRGMIFICSCIGPRTSHERSWIAT